MPLWTRFYKFHPLHPSYPLNLSSRKNWKLLLEVIRSRFVDHVTILFIYEQGRVLLSRWSLINASYAVRSAISATDGLVVFIHWCCHRVVRLCCSVFGVRGVRYIRRRGRQQHTGVCISDDNVRLRSPDCNRRRRLHSTGGVLWQITYQMYK